MNSNTSSNVVSYRPRYRYFRHVFHREADTTKVRQHGMLLCQDCERLLEFAVDLGLSIPEGILKALIVARRGFLDTDLEMGEVRWRGIKLCHVMEPLKEAIREWGSKSNVEVYPPKFCPAPAEVEDKLGLI
ncbi:hypothetical protein [Rubellicoccus peritrichatus]|uniref:Uncharacterized protein n=1 Tax=Rubellicoccus peritrichatus TaxID=3080537 RepID=A0AAQ3L5N0_9BACT|nr:hypothetical protein [Puniceicoccus sp. CR14]WOO39650.1 hypothetical protein RZN69_13585 [Puniceicoccus sp. CR14]